jgi:hypothetical protein
MLNPGCYDRVGAWGSLTVMATRFESDIHGVGIVGGGFDISNGRKLL